MAESIICSHGLPESNTSDNKHTYDTFASIDSYTRKYNTYIKNYIIVFFHGGSLLTYVLTMRVIHVRLVSKTI